MMSGEWRGKLWTCPDHETPMNEPEGPRTGAFAYLTSNVHHGETLSAAKRWRRAPWPGLSGCLRKTNRASAQRCNTHHTLGPDPIAQGVEAGLGPASTVPSSLVTNLNLISQPKHQSFGAHRWQCCAKGCSADIPFQSLLFFLQLSIHTVS